MAGGRSSASWALLGWILCSCTDTSSTVEEAVDPIAAVDPFLGSGGQGFGAGSIVPGPRLPFGLANPSPDTSNNGGAPSFSHCGGYSFDDDEIRGFSQLHLSGTGLPDYGVLMLMPVTEELDGPITERTYRDRFDHHAERASVGAYAVHLLDADVEVEITATLRTALYRISYPSDRPAGLVFDLDHGLGNGETLDGAIRLEDGALFGHLLHQGDFGSRYGGFSLFFAIRFSQAPSLRNQSEDGRKILLDFGAPDGPVLVQIGLSFVDEAGARAALEAEWTDFDFDGTRDRAVQAWREVILSKVRVEGGTEEDRSELYTALYHAYQMPTLLSDHDGRYRGLDGAVHEADFLYYSDFSLWDTFRTTHPLFTLLTPSIQEDFNRTLTRMLDDGGHLPRWPFAHGYTWVMVGNHGESMLIDAYLRGVGGFDLERVYAHLVAAADRPIEAKGITHAARECIESYLRFGYCAADLDYEAASRTLENAYNDWMLANLAETLGKSEDAARFRERSKSWRHLLNPETGLIEAKDSAGEFLPDFNPELFSVHFVEGNARQWTTYVPHDTLDLAEAMGGPGRLIDYLTELFESSATADNTPFPDLWYWHGNEIDLHAAYMFAELGRPDLTERFVGWIMDERYGAGPDGLDGNDDGGTLSAWYVFSSFGFYPLAGSDRYIIGVPRFDRIEVDLSDRTLVIAKQGRGNVARVELDGRILDGPYLRHQDLIGAKELLFILED